MNKFISLSAVSGLASAVHNILDYGAVPDLTDTPSAYANSQAIADALIAASGDETDREVLIPADKTFNIMSFSTVDLHDFSLRIDGTVLASANYLDYPNKPTGLEENYLGETNE